MSVNLEAGRFSTVMTMAERVIDLADGDLVKGKMMTVSPLTTAIAYHGLSRCLMGLPGWKDEFERAIAAADAIDPAMRSGVLWIVRLVPIANGILLPDAIAFRETAEILSAAEQFGDNFVLTMAQATRAIIVVHQEGPVREAGRKLLAELVDPCVQNRFFSYNLLVIQVHTAREKAQLGDLMARSNLCVQRSMVCSPRTRHSGLHWRPPSSSSRSCNAAPTRTSAKHKQPSTVWPHTRPNPGLSCTTSGCCGCAHWWHRPKATTQHTETFGTATERWPTNWL